MESSDNPSSSNEPDSGPQSPKEKQANELATVPENQASRNLTRSNTISNGPPQPTNNISVNIQTNTPSESDQTTKGYLLPLYNVPYPNYNSAAVGQTNKMDTPLSPTTTNVIINQPTAATGPSLPRPWKSGLCSVCDDVHICCCGFFCFGCYACSIAADIDESCCVPCCVPGWLVSMRTKIRTKENIEGSILRDCCVSYWCAGCALCQLAREVKYIQSRG